MGEAAVLSNFVVPGINGDLRETENGRICLRRVEDRQPHGAVLCVLLNDVSVANPARWILDRRAFNADDCEILTVNPDPPAKGEFIHDFRSNLKNV